jgi:RND superfamily putative drug exporter
VAASTAGRAVIFAGATVAISVVGLATIGLDFITKMGIGASLSVLTSVAVAVTLLPAVLALLGHKVDRLKIPFIKTPDDSLAAAQKTAVARWGRFVTRHAWVFLLVPLALMLLFAAPVARVQLGAADAGTAPKSTTQRVAYDWLAEGFGPGFNGPLIIAVDTKDGMASAETLQQAIADTRRSSRSTPRARRRTSRRPTSSRRCARPRSPTRSRARGRSPTSAARPRRSRTSRRRSTRTSRGSCCSWWASRS